MSIEFNQVTAKAKANIYFDGKVVSHTIVTSDGARKTLGLIYPGSYHFNTAEPEIMEIIAGSCQVRLQGEAGTKTYVAGTQFNVPGQSSFDIEVENEICEYICSFG
jgi:uncharacterized protein YaiE (UPF0345 family)